MLSNVAFQSPLRLNARISFSTSTLNPNYRSRKPFSTLLADHDGYGALKKSTDPGAAHLSPHKRPLAAEPAGDAAVLISGRYLAVGGGGAAWERRTSSPSFSGSELTLRPAGAADDAPPSAPGSPSASSGRFRFRYSRSFTFRRSVSSTSGGNGSRRSSTSPDKGRRAVQVTQTCSLRSPHALN